MAQRSFWAVDSAGCVHGLIGSIKWAREHCKGMEGPFEKQRDARAAALAKFPGKPVADRKTGRLLGRCVGLSDHATHQLRIDVIERGLMLFRRQDVKIAA